MAETHVLIVEDEERVAETYALQLNEHETTVAYDGEEAIEELDRRGEEFDVALLDRRLPGIPGEDVLDEIRDRNLDCTVAMVTAVDPDFDIIQMGFDDYITKPTGKAELRDLVERLTTQAGYDQQVREHLVKTAKKAVLEAEKGPEELEVSEEYARLRSAIAESRDKLDQALTGDVFVELLLRETGDRLYLVLQYDADSWQYRYVGERAERLMATADTEFGSLLDQFRREGDQNARLNNALGLDGYDCSLHLFESIVLLHFALSDERGVLCGFDPDAASHLTDFVSVVQPYLEQADLEA